MKVHLMFPDHELPFDPHAVMRNRKRRSRERVPEEKRRPEDDALIQDLRLETVVHAMAGDNEFLALVAMNNLLGAFSNDIQTILYRQEILRDCISNAGVIAAIYNLAMDAVALSNKHWWGLSSHFASSLLYSSTELMGDLLESLRSLRTIAEAEGRSFKSTGMTQLFATLSTELNDDYLSSIEDHLNALSFRDGVLLSAELGEWNESTNLVLRKPPGKRRTWIERLLNKGPRGFTFRLDERDEAGAQILADIRNRGVHRVAVALAQATDHVVSFFRILQTELAFYIGCTNLYQVLSDKGEPICYPSPQLPGCRKLNFAEMYDVSLALKSEARIVGSSINADGKQLTIITGANQGGKSTFLRSVGLAQLMMQSGMFVGAEHFESDICPTLFTHFKRQEDEGMNSGKLDEELQRMSAIANGLTPESMILFNESFAATNVREGSELARQIVLALLEKNVRVLYVTHLYDFARTFFERKSRTDIFLRAEREFDGSRTFRLVEGEPLMTSFGDDLYRQIFEEHENPAAVS
jgi:hypothetical protein